MKEITQEEFEQSIRDVIDGKCTRIELQKRYHMDRITLNSKIQELYVHNIELYMEFTKKFPYIPREYTHINYRAMIIDIMKKGYSKKQAAEQYGIHDRTISRKIHIVEKTDPDLVMLYREVSSYKKRQKQLPPNLQKEVDELPEEEVFIGGIYDKREKELMEREKKYYESRIAGISDMKAYGNRRTIKDLRTLYRIEIEKKVREQREAENKRIEPKDEIEGR